MVKRGRYSVGMTDQTAVPNEYKVLQPGDTVAGHKVLRCKRISERVEGDTYASWVALCDSMGNESHRYVTWLVYAGPDGFRAESGHYFLEDDDYESAVGDYDKRFW